MNRAFPVFTILPARTRVSDAVRQATAAGVHIWLTPVGTPILAPFGRPGWRRLNIRTLEESAPCVA